IGEAIALRLAAEGAAVVVSGHQATNTRRVAEAIRANGGEAFAATVDVRDSAAVRAAVELAVERYGGLDIAVANAAMAGSRAYVGPLLDVTDEDWRQIIEVNLTGVFFTAREAARVMIPRRAGSIITIGSVNSFVPEANVPAYAASKGGVLMLTKSLARDLAPYGVRANGIAPGATETPHLSATIAAHGRTWSDISTTIPMGRQGQASEIASVAAFLASNDASYMTGEMLIVDGGMLCT
ncbi:MAG: SDR family oxidoreductase, partial [Thermomicrobiales bacterium]|nr:SDR family oxidoreductase [Thermomicrobiales bacterium]